MTLLRRPGETIEIRKARLAVSTGDRLVVRSSGGGGFGDPTLRPAELIERDLRQGKVTASHVAAVYQHAKPG